MSLKIGKNTLIWGIIIYVFVFQRALTSVSSAFNYLDEIFTLIVVGMIVLCLVSGKILFSKEEITILFLLAVVCVIGILSNLSSGLIKNWFGIVTDVISTIKVWVAYYALIMTNWSSLAYDRLIKALARIGRLLTWIMFACMLLSQIVDIGMTASARYGIQSFQFVYNVPGNFSKLFYFLIPLLTADLYYKSSRYKKTVIAISLVVWASTMRSRAFAFIAVYLVMAAFFFSANGKNIGESIKKRIKVIYLVPVILIAIAISWNQLIFYFTTDTQARSVLLRYGIITLVNYFPLGAGFGTFGSDVAATNYSPLYVRYGFNSFYGMRQGEEYFLNDNYWPMIMGQFGFFGTLIIGIALLKLMKLILKETKDNKYIYFSAFSAVGFLLLSSVASKSYSEYSSICVFLLLGLFVKRSRKYRDQY